MYSAGFEPATQEIKQLSTYALDCATTGIRVCSVYMDLRRLPMIGGRMTDVKEHDKLSGLLVCRVIRP